MTGFKKRVKRKTRYPKQSNQQTDQIVAQMIHMTNKPPKKQVTINHRKKS